MRIPPRITQALAVAILGSATLLTVAVLLFIILFVLGKGLPGVSLEFLFSAPRDMVAREVSFRFLWEPFCCR